MGNRKNLYKKVITCLRDYPETRNSDIELTRRIWLVYYRAYLRWFADPLDNEALVPLKYLNELPREDNIKRIRAAIQNDEKKFIPTNWKVAQKRKWEEIEWRKALGYGAFGGEETYNKTIQWNKYDKR